MLSDVGGNLAIRNPQAGQFRFAAKDDRLIAAVRRNRVVFPADSEVHFDVAPGALGLGHEVAREVLRILPEVTVDVDHERKNNASG